MKKNKGLKIAIIIIVVLIVLIVAAFALLYVFTDLFKSNKQLFAKYMASMLDEKTAFVSSNIENYLNKKKSTPYENNGSFSANLTTSNNNSSDNTLTGATDSASQINNMLNFSNNTRINFSGRTDKVNNKSEQNINIFYTNDVSLPFNYKHVGDIYAVQADFVLPNYIGVENNNIPDLLQKLNVNVTGLEVPSKLEVQEIQSLNLSAEEITYLSNNYLIPVLDSLTDDKFSKMENPDGSTSYTITLTLEDIKNVAIQILQILSQDTAMMDKLNGIYQEIFEKTDDLFTTESVNNIISNVQQLQTEEGDISFTITKNNGSVNQITLSVSTSETTEIILAITKNETDSNISYDITISSEGEDEQTTVGVGISYNNINSNSVAENYSITANINDVANVEYNFSNTINFTNSVNIADFDLNNTIILNNYQAADVQVFLNQLVALIAQKNASQMQEIGYPTELINPMYMWIMGPSLSLYIYNMASSSILNSNLDEQLVASNNQQFINYEGIRTGSQVRTLVNTIISHNNSNTDDVSKQIQITNEDYGTGGTLAASTTPITVQAPALVSANNYKVTFAYDPTTGYITACGITEVENDNSNNTTVNNANIVSPNGITNYSGSANSL